MSDSLFFGLIFFALIISAIGSVVWWVAVIWVGKKVFDRIADSIVPEFAAGTARGSERPDHGHDAEGEQSDAAVVQDDVARTSLRAGLP
jgi:hypothetical protein